MLNRKQIKSAMPSRHKSESDEDYRNRVMERYDRFVQGWNNRERFNKLSSQAQADFERGMYELHDWLFYGPAPDSANSDLERHLRDGRMKDRLSGKVDWPGLDDNNDPAPDWHLEPRAVDY